ncbi:MAG: DUF4251 domain-containing protein [Bacteroidales bacterium]|nr:DUF4251 domain-containing protein [Bacteroidales bacterium]
MKKIFVCVALAFMAANVVVHGQEKKSKKQLRREHAEEVRQLIDAQDFVFVANQALPMAGPTRVLTTPYDLTVGKDTVSAFLPYFGRAYVAPSNPLESGITFVSKDFAYTLSVTKKNGREIQITPKDVPKRYELFLSVSESGSATLSVNDVTRQPIRFNGSIEPRTRNAQR